ncbi:zinc-type alcohol dehydrogenase-like protein SE_1777 [Spodoptera frugiperda]|uniref:Zinc-type alcohol dehydrogenase-like protein SE_1777 n=1 Tax=Spodoptera frugiperda TaxID=7108 RepID=A0A9R0E9C8_SPOFR|nr:zinc-type alcohol dehydrogenase-like protein SE_1777 [Spodoptera frugiperda]
MTIAYIHISVILLFASAAHASQNNTMLKIPKTMRAVGLYKYLPISDVNSLIDVEVKVPSVTPSDVLVEVKATAVNPIDTKQRAPKPNVEAIPRILGWDGAGVVVSKGEKANLFNVGDEVFFTGDLRKSGSNAQYMAVDQYLVGIKPKNWTFEQAAAIPLVTLTACESIFDRLLLSEKDKGKSILIINSAGGVGSVATQIVKNLGLKVIGTASRPETQAFTRQFGADIVLNHTQDLIPQLEANGFGAGVDFILVNFDPAPYWDTMMKAIKPQGKICMLVDSSAPVNIATLKDKSITLVGEMMFTRMKYDTEDRIRHYEIFKEVSKWMEEGKLRSPLTKTLSPINAANLREAHKIMEEKKMIGKLVLTGF